jgi:hypothetical protein
MLTKSGYFFARQGVVDGRSVAVKSQTGLVSAGALLLALEARNPQVVPVSLFDPWPKSGIAFAEVDGWEAVAAIVAKAGGKALIIEYPPPPGRKWSRFWMRGQGWGSQLPTWPDWSVPGLIPASQLGNLLRNPTKFKWVPNETGNWGGAGKWLEYIAASGPLTITVFGFLIAFFAGCAVYLISIEERARFAGIAVKYLALTPAAILVAGRITGLVGISYSSVALLAAWAGLVLGTQILGALLGIAFPRTHPMLGIAILGFAATAASNPMWSAYSNVLGQNVLPVSPEAVGAFFAYLVGVCAFSRGAGPAPWIGRGLALLTLIWGLTGHAWWVGNQWVLATLPAFALLVGEKAFRPWMLVPIALLPLVDANVIRHGVVWAPGNLLEHLDQRDSLNLARHAEFLVCYAFLGTLALAGGIAVFVERFFFQEIRRTLLRDSRTKSLFQAGLICAALGILQPLLLYAALTCFIGGVLVVLSDTARSM